MIAAPVFAIVTPFAAGGAVDHGALRDSLAFLAERGVRSVIAGGTTGEFPSLTEPERLAVLRTTRESFPGAVMANISACAVEDVRRLAAHSAPLCDAFLLLPPFYFAAAPADGVLAFLHAAVHDAPRPVLLYDFPRHTGNAITPAMLAAAMETIGPVAGLKDSGGTLESALAKKQAAPRARVLLGGDSLALAALRSGLDGSVTGAGNAIPEFLVQLTAAWEAGDAARAAALQEEGARWGEVRRRLGLGEVALTKAALARRLPGFPVHVRPPLSPLEPALAAAVHRELDTLMQETTATRWLE